MNECCSHNTREMSVCERHSHLHKCACCFWLLTVHFFFKFVASFECHGFCVDMNKKNIYECHGDFCFVWQYCFGSRDLTIQRNIQIHIEHFNFPIGGIFSNLKRCGNKMFTLIINRLKD